MSDPLADLKRRAYARPEDDGDAAAAQAELAELAREQQRAERGLDIPGLPPHSVTDARGKQLLAATSLAALALASIAVVTRPVDSLEVFDRPPAPSDQPPPEWMLEVLGASHDGLDPADVESVRWLAHDDLSTLFGYRVESGAVCVLLIVGDSGAGTCTPEDEFDRVGLELQGGGQFPRVNWGPTGGARFSDGEARP